MNRHCERCGEELNEKTLVSLELSNTTGKYHKGGIPAREESQGWFDFGQACARAVLKNDGICEPIRKAV